MSLTDRTVITEKSNYLSSLFDSKRGDYHGGKILLSTANEIIVLVIWNDGRLTLKSFSLVPNEHYERARKSFSLSMETNGLPEAPLAHTEKELDIYGKRFLDSVSGKNKKGFRIQLSLMTKLVPEIVSVSLMSDDIWTRSHGALIAIHLEACRTARETILSLSRLRKILHTNPQGVQAQAETILRVRKDEIAYQAIRIGLHHTISSLN
jgi:hypothetical protein